MELSVNHNNLHEFTLVMKHQIIHARARLAFILLTIMCTALLICSFIAGQLTFGGAFTGLWLLLVVTLLLIEKLPSRKSSPKPWRFRLDSPADFLSKLESKVSLNRMNDGSGYAVFHYKGMTVFFLLQECHDISMVNDVRKRLYRHIPADSKPGKKVSFPNRFLQLILITANSDLENHLPVSIQNNAEQLMGRTVPMLKMAVDKASGILYIPGLDKSAELGELKEYFHVSRFILKEIDG